jgi:hypothetical protein
MPVVMVLAMWSNVKQLLYRLPKKFRDTQSEQNRRRVIPLLERDNRLSRHTDRMRQFPPLVCREQGYSNEYYFHFSYQTNSDQSQ